MKKNRSGSGEKPLTGQPLSRILDVIMGDFSHIPRTLTISLLNVLKTASGGWHHGAVPAYSEKKLHLRHTQNLFVNQS